jgi:hypothetical protein
MKTTTLKIFILFTSSALFLSTLEAQVNYSISGNTAYVTSSPNASGNIVIISNDEGYPITSISNYALSFCSSLTSVILPNTVTNIGLEAFGNCGYLTNVTIPNSVVSIGEAAFEFSYSLTNIIIPNGVANIGQNAFEHCVNLANVTIPNSVVNMGYATFIYCSSMTNATIGTNLTSIGDDTFYSCKNLANITIGNSVTNIGQLAFEGCTNLTKVTFFGNAPVPGTDAFALVPATVYYYYGTSGWSTTYDGLPTVELFLPPQIGGGSSVGIQSSEFGFNLTGGTNQTIIIEASTNLIYWQPVWTNTLTNTNITFTDSQWTNYSQRYYRAR